MSETPSQPLPGLAGPGHAWYYATRRLPAAQRLPQHVLQAWWRAVSEVPRRVADPGVAQTKLDWWQRQLSLLPTASGPDHPLLRALQPSLQSRGVPLALLHDAVEQVIQGTRQTRWLDQAGLDRHLDAGPGNVARASGWLLGADSAEAQAWLGALGVALGRLAGLRDLGRELRHDRLPLPIDALAAHAIPARQLMEPQHADAVRRLLQTQLDEVAAQLRQLRANHPPTLGAARVPALAQLRIAQALLGELMAGDVDLLRMRVSLPPTRMLWAAWLASWRG